MNIFLGEDIGTFFLILLGNGVVANAVLSRTKGNNSGWIVISFGWAMAVFVGVFVGSKLSGAHLNPAVSIAFAILGKLEWTALPAYVAGQMVGAMAGATAVWAAYYKHFLATEDVISKISAFSTGPAINSPFIICLQKL